MREQSTPFVDLEIAVEVWLAAEEVPLDTLLALEPGGVLPLGREPDAPVELVVNGTVLATGELVVIDGKFGVRVIDVQAARGADVVSERPSGGPTP